MRLSLFFIGFVLLTNQIIAQKELTAVAPANSESNVNVGILKWTGAEGNTYDLYFGLTALPPLYKSDLDTIEEKPVILELNKKYYWKVVEKKDGKMIRESKVFSFSTLPIQLNPNVKYNSFVDMRDYKVYWTVTVNGKEWMAQNLDYNYPDSSYYYDNLLSNKVYGKLYSGYLLKSKQSEICPTGWHIPSLKEWEDLLSNFGGSTTAGQQLKESSDSYWLKSDYIRNNNSGLTILPAGSRDSKPSYSNLKKYAMFWTTTEDKNKPSEFYKIDLGFMRDGVKNSSSLPAWSYSIRCIKD